MRLPRLATARMLLLLSVLVVVAFVTVYQHTSSRSWNNTLEASVYPVNGDASAATARYIDTLSDADFGTIDRWAAREAERYGLPLNQPFRITLGAPVEAIPPALGNDASPLEAIFWSLRFRWWAWQNTPDQGGLSRVRVFVVYHQGHDGHALAHSLGLQKGLLGLVNAFARDTQHEQNLIVIAHELLHTVGARDKYNPDGSPLWPQGFADPDKGPRRLQSHAEIMAGRLVTHEGLMMAPSLSKVVVNRWTAREINWVH